MTKQLIVLLFCIGCCAALRAQPELTKSVVASSGGNFSQGTLSLSSTVAEMTMVTTLSGGTADLFQGFQNSAWMVQEVFVNPVAGNELTVALYPNPASAFLNLEMADANAGKRFIVLNDLLGKAVRIVSVSDLQSKVHLDVSDLPSGLYALSITNSSNQKVFNQTVSIVH